jgi:hypothetical protein
VSAAPDGVYFGTSINSTVYRWSAERGVTPVYTAVQEQSIYSLRRGGDGNLYAATGDKGMVYQIKPGANPRETRAARLIEATQLQALAIGTSPSGDLVIGTGNNAAAYRIALAQNGAGLFQSNVFDAKNIVRWGALRVTGNGVAVETRSGNTLEPDTTWSTWQPAATNDLGELRVASPTARYLQYRARLSGGADAAQLSRIEVLFRASNTAPTLTLSGLRGGEYFRAKQRLTWTAQDADGDTLRYRMWLSEDNGTTWKPVALTDNSSNSFELDTTKWRDGVYRARVEVSDAVSNPEDPQRTEVSSLSFTIDNTAPRLTGQMLAAVEAGKSWTLRAVAQDDSSPVAGAEWRIARATPTPAAATAIVPTPVASPSATRTATPRASTSTAAATAPTPAAAITLATATPSGSSTASAGATDNKEAGWMSLAAGDGIFDSRREELIAAVEASMTDGQLQPTAGGATTSGTTASGAATTNVAAGQKVELRARDAAGNTTTVTLTLP